MLSFQDYSKKSVIFVFSSKDHLRFANENLVLEDKKTGKIKNQMPCIRIFCVFVIGTTTITSRLMEKATHFGFSIIFLRQNFRPYAFHGNKSEGNTLLRKIQYETKNHELLASAIVQNKIQNQKTLISKIRNKSDKQKEAEKRLSELLHGLKKKQPESNEHLLGIEGNASKIFFSAYFEEIGWQARRPRTKIDPLNTLLDIGYTFLFNFMEAHLRLYGFDLYVGVYHRLFYQRKSLVCDLVEPFRCIIEESIRKAFNLKQFQGKDFIKRNEKWILRIDKNKKYTKVLFESLLEFREDIYFYTRDYYRAFIRQKGTADFPVFELAKPRSKEC